MKNFFLIFGYGVSQNILKDENYNFYLKMTFNQIYDLSIKNKIAQPIIMLCGGQTDLFSPYQRSEGQEMLKWFKAHIKKNPQLINLSKNWSFIPETKSICTLENLLNSQAIIKKLTTKKANIFIFCEQIRGRRIKILAKKIFKNHHTQIVSVDFDVSANRYLSPEYLRQKENTELKYSLWALKNSQNFKKHHRMYEEKFKYLRQIPQQKQMKAIRKWWDDKARNNELF